jgi:hypothetical protein
MPLIQISKCSSVTILELTHVLEVFFAACLLVQRFAGWLREPKLSLHSSNHCIVAICVN